MTFDPSAMDDDDELVVPPPTDDHDDDGPADDDDEPPTAAGGAPAPAGNRRERQARRKEGLAADLRAANDRTAALERQLAEMASQVGQSAAASRQVAEAVSRGQQRPQESPEEVARKKLRAAAARVRDDDPGSAAAFLDEQVAINSELYQAQAAAAAAASEARIRQSIPQPDPPHLRALFQKAEWLRDGNHAGAVNAVARRIASSRNINWDQTPPGETRDQLINQAIVEYSAVTGLPHNVPKPASQRNISSVAGTGSRSFAGAAGAEGPATLNEFQMSLADQDPNFRDLPKQKRYAAYAKMVSREAKQLRR